MREIIYEKYFYVLTRCCFMTKLILTDTYDNAFSLLCEELSGNTSDTEMRNLVFCEEKVSLMAERRICEKHGGTFNTEVYSFGNYMRVKKPNINALSKEGSAMVIKRVLDGLPLGVLKNSKNGLPSAMFELISQLKSASVTPEILKSALQPETKTRIPKLLAEKLTDVINVYAEYEEYLKNNNYEDQSSSLSFLSEVLSESSEIPKTNVFLVGFSAFTSQTRKAVEILVKRAKSVTSVLVEGDNKFVYLNETSNDFRKICKRAGVSLKEYYRPTENNNLQKLLMSGLFNPLYEQPEYVKTESIHYFVARSIREEVEKIANVIKQSVMNNGMRYREITIALSDIPLYKEDIKTCFSVLDIPYYLDEKKKPDNHPLITLILNYYDLKRKGLESDSFCAFFKNPLVNADKTFTDAFERYVKRYNLFYNKLKEPFVYPDTKGDSLSEFEEFRKNLLSFLSCNSVEDLLKQLNAKQKLEEFSESLKKIGEEEEKAINDQIYDAIDNILREMRTFLPHGLNVEEERKVFLSAISALELSIIPQYNDAVFIGGFKEASLSCAKYLFVAGLTSNVPSVKEDVALLGDCDIDSLKNVKILVEPTIKVVNKRVKESVALGMCAFSEKLFLSYPITSFNGDENKKSEALKFITENFETKDFPASNDYLTEEQGELSFAKACSDFYEGKINDFSEAASFYKLNESEKLEKLLNESNKQIKIYLNENKRIVFRNTTSPTALENYYACPYKYFLTYGLRLKESEDGRINPLSYGNLMHEIFKEYVKRFSEITDKSSSDSVFNDCKKKALNNLEFERFLKDQEDGVFLERALLECEEYCYKTFLAKTKSNFKTNESDVEVNFGVNCIYPPVSLCNGKAYVSGKIDRVDTFGEFCRIIDYKTGSAKASLEGLFAGRKMQLYLYGAVMKDKKIAGMYYLPINNEFKPEKSQKSTLAVGQTLNDAEVIRAQDCTFFEKGESEFLPITLKNGEVKGAVDEQTINAFVKYALALSEQAIKQTEEGVVVPSAYENECEYCNFVALCPNFNCKPRKVKTVNPNTIMQATEKEKDA